MVVCLLGEIGIVRRQMRHDVMIICHSKCIWDKLGIVGCKCCIANTRLSKSHNLNILDSEINLQIKKYYVHKTWTNTQITKDKKISKRSSARRCLVQIYQQSLESASHNNMGVKSSKSYKATKQCIISMVSEKLISNYGEIKSTKGSHSPSHWMPCHHNVKVSIKVFCSFNSIYNCWANGRVVVSTIKSMVHLDNAKDQHALTQINNHQLAAWIIFLHCPPSRPYINLLAPT